MLYNEHHKREIVVLAVSLLLFLFPFLSYSQTDQTASDFFFILKGNTRFLNGKSAEGVDMELKKDGKTITKITSGKNGKYYLEMEASTSNLKNEYLLYVTQAGSIPKTLSINTYVPKEEFALRSFVRYDFSLEIKMIETTVKDIVLERPSGKIRWDNTEHAFAFDQVYARIIQKEEEKLKDDPDKYLRELAEKKKKEQEEITKRKEQEEIAKKKAEEAKRLADQKEKEEADRILQQNLEAMKLEMKRKHIQDSLNNMDVRSEEKTTIEIKKFEKPVMPDDVDQNAFDGTGAYSMNIAKNLLKAAQDRMNKKKAANLSTKYETNNTLTSLLNMVDEHDKKMKKQ